MTNAVTRNGKVNLCVISAKTLKGVLTIMKEGTTNSVAHKWPFAVRIGISIGTSYSEVSRSVIRFKGARISPLHRKRRFK